MSELLFKLKKDGRTVGYLWIRDGYITYHTDPKSQPEPSIPFWDTCCPFVCKDKNDKEIWQNDEVWLRRDGFKKQKCTAVAAYESWAWLYWKDHSTSQWEVAIPADIELIEDSNA